MGSEAAVVNHKKGWVCVYRSEGGLSAVEYQAKILNMVETYPFLRKHLDKVNDVFVRAQPYLKKYSSNIGFVGYQAEK